MNHLTDYGCPDIQVPFILRDEQEYISMLLQTPDFRFKDFRAFLETKRWELNSNGVLQSYQTETSHWGTKQRILQGWLFFALIACIVRTDEPLLNFGDLVKSNYLTTANLPEKLQVWHDWAKNNSERAELRKRLIEADRALELARKVIYNNLVESRFDLEMNISLSDGTSDNVALPNAISGGKAGNDYHATDFQKGQNSDRDGPLSLCLMVLGETLTAAKFQIMKDLGLRINGWFTNEDEGWGPPSYIIKSMEQSNWCPNALKVMRGQLGSSAILLSAALKVRSQEAISPEQHQNCTPEKCVHVPGQTPGRASARDERKYTKKRISYPPQHHEQLCDMKECEPLGPKMGDVYKILERADLTTEAPDFPLFRIISENIGVKVKPVDRPVRGITVEKWTREDNRKYWRPSFAAISHVWSQGMGNESANELQSCQLKLIRTALQKADIDNGEWDTETFSFSTPLIKKALGDKWIRNRHYFLSKPFWMDTLAIPVKDDGRDVKSVPANFTELKKRAIRQIYQVFNSATCTIVIDKDLCKTFSDPILIRILTSAWMRRLWSLQEAFLSRRLLFAFKGDDGVILQDMDKQIGGQYGLSNANSTALHLSMAELNKRKLYQNLMGDDREVRNRRDHPIETRGSMVIASAWRSSRWRSKPPSVLTPVLYYRGTTIENAGGMAGEERSEEDGREIMMRDFWNLIHRNYEGSIPAGFIFLPGERLSIPAFGWAPRTWMSGKDEDHPYPLSMVGKPTELHQEGLLVHYPGFLLHCGDARMVLGTDKASDWELTFPTDKSLTERYRATNTKELGRPHVAQKVRLCEGSDFGIILSSPKPGESPPEIGLLVEIYNEMWRRKEPERVNKKIYCCQIIRRVVVCRISDASTLAAGFHLPSGKLGQPPIGELMPEDTMWFVDGYLDSKIRKDFLRPRTPIKAEDKIGSVTFGSLSAVKANALNPRTPTVSPPVSTPTTNGNSSPKVEPNQEEKGGQADPNTVNNIVKWLTRW